MRLLLLRHAQTPSNVTGALDTRPPGAELTELGHRQAGAAAQALAGAPLEAIYVSPAVRTQQTAAPIAASFGLVPTEIPELREIAAGRYEMATDHDSVLGYVGSVADWIERRLETRIPEAENGLEFLTRFDAGIARVAAGGHTHALVVSHGAALRTWVSLRVDGLETHEHATAGFHNTGSIEIEGDPESGWELVSWNPDAIGGVFLDDEAAADPTGRSTEETTD